MNPIQNIISRYFDTDGSPLDNGALYFGVSNQNPETTPITVYWDSAGTQPAAQPVRTINGAPARSGSPAILYAAADFSVTVRNRKGALVATYAVSNPASASTAMLPVVSAADLPTARAAMGAATAGALKDSGITGASPRATRIDVASVAGTVDLTANAPNTDDIRITGALAITGFTVASDRVLRVTAGGAFTLTNGAGLVTQTGANIVAAAGDTFMLRATAANVVEVLSYVSTVPAVSSVQVSTRQTVLSGPVDTNGFPTFLPATSVNLNLTSQNISTGVNALVAAAAGGANANVEINAVGQAVANLTWTGFTANQLNFLPVSIASGVLTTLTPVTLAPIEQWGGTPSVTAGQYTFNIQQGIMWLGNGTTATAVNHVIVGEAVVGASTITSTTAYSYRGKYYSEQTGLAVSTAYSKTHNIGSKFIRPLIYAECVTNDAVNGCVVGDRILLAQGTASGGGNPVAGVFTGTNRLTAFATTGGSGLLLFSKSAGTGNAGSTIANYKLVFDIERVRF